MNTHLQGHSYLRWIRITLTLAVFVCVSLVARGDHAVHQATSSEDSALALLKQASFLAELKACQEAQAANPGKCGLFGKIQIVKSFPDVKVQVVDSFPDLKVQVVKSFADKPGKWQFVDSFPDYKVQYVNSFADLKVKFVDSFPGCN